MVKKKTLLPVQKVQIYSLGQEDPLRRKKKPTNPVDRGAWWAIVHGVTNELDMT